VSFAAITLCVPSQQVIIVVVYFVIDSVRNLLDTPSYTGHCEVRNMSHCNIKIYIKLCTQRKQIQYLFVIRFNSKEYLIYFLLYYFYTSFCS
jgi:hypothetical protein